MFTGIIEETGVIQRILPLGKGKRLTISADRILNDLKVEDSVCVSGVCLTVVAVDAASFTVEAVGATLEKTTLNNAHTGQTVNLERALRLGDRLGGHMVQGHVNGIGKIIKLQKHTESWLVEIEIPGELCKYVVAEGSIAIDGISLTIAYLSGHTLGLSIIPYTFKHTTLRFFAVGDRCNIETDMIGKYIESLNPFKNSGQTEKKITTEWLKKAGY
jgi:riboflavin synthase